MILFNGHSYERARDSSFKEAQIRPVWCLVLLVHTLCKPRLALSRLTCLIDLHLFAVFCFFVFLHCVEQLRRPPAPFSEQLKAHLCPDAVAAYSITFFPALINLPHQGKIISHHSGDKPEPAATSMCNDFCQAVIRVVGEIERFTRSTRIQERCRGIQVYPHCFFVFWLVRIGCKHWQHGRLQTFQENIAVKEKPVTPALLRSLLGLTMSDVLEDCVASPKDDRLQPHNVLHKTIRKNTTFSSAKN